jgi:RNA methyltransferase, TrmH family
MGRREVEKEVKLHGRAACRAMFAARPDDVIRVYLVDELKQDYRELLEHCREHRLAYHIVDEAELEKVTGAEHHEGICILGRARRQPSLDQIANARGPQTLLLLDGVANPHNLGAILRTAAHFGASAVIGDENARLTSAAMRVAEGGAEYVDVINVPELAKAVELLVSKGFDVVATTSHRADSVFIADVSERTAWVIGNEREGVSEAVAAASPRAVRIPGTGRVESLNVSVAAALLLAESSRRRRPARPRTSPRSGPRTGGRGGPRSGGRSPRGGPRSGGRSNPRHARAHPRRGR